MKIKRPTTVDDASFRYGIQIAAEVASDYDHMSAHTHLVSECILGKLNVMARRPKKNPNAKALDQVISAIERKVSNIDSMTRFMAAAQRLEMKSKKK